MIDDHDNALDKPPVQIFPTAYYPEPSNEVSSSLENISVEEPVNAGAPIDFIQNNNLELSISQENTRAKIALYFTYFFLFMVALTVVIPFVIYFLQPTVFPNPIDGAKDLLTLLTSVLAGPFGFIVGFYFKQNNDR